MLGVVELRGELSRLTTYIRDSRIWIEEDIWEGPKLVIHACATDAYIKGQDVDLLIKTFIPPMHNADQFADFVLWRLCRIAIHEEMEGFMRDGRRYRDPGHA
jgi:hypothetical protein